MTLALKYIWRLLFWLVVVVLSGYLIYIARVINGQIEPLSFAAMLDGTAWRPYVYRQLVPQFSKMLTYLTPNQLAQQLEQAGFFFAQLNLAADRPVASMWALLLTVGFFVVWLWSFRKLCLAFYPSLVDLATILAIVGLTFFIFRHALYDFPTLALFSLALLTLHYNRLNSYLLVFTLAAINKETAFFLLLLSALHTRKLSLIISQALIFTIIRGLLFITYHANDGQVAEFNLRTHYTFYAQFPEAAIILTGIVLLTAALIGYGWHQKPLLLRRALLLFSPLLLIHLFFGKAFEIRIFLEAYSALILLMVPTIGTLYQAPFGRLFNAA